MRRRTSITPALAPALIGAALCLAPRASRADSPPPAWPVRANVSMPFGSTVGREPLHGFTWGFRTALLAYPTSSARGFGFGGYADGLIDANTHSMWSLGAISTAPLAKADFIDVRIGGSAGVRWNGEGNDDARRLALGVLSELVLPAYLYDFRVGLRLDGTFDARGMSATSVLVELDVVAVLGLIVYGASLR